MKEYNRGIIIKLRKELFIILVRKKKVNLRFKKWYFLGKLSLCSDV